MNGMDLNNLQTHYESYIYYIVNLFKTGLIMANVNKKLINLCLLLFMDNLLCLFLVDKQISFLFII